MKKRGGCKRFVIITEKNSHKIKMSILQFECDTGEKMVFGERQREDVFKRQQKEERIEIKMREKISDAHQDRNVQISH